MFAILVIMALFTTFMTTPIALAIYRPARNFSSQHNLEESSKKMESDATELRILMCIRRAEDSSSLVNLIELCRSTKLAQLKLYAMQLLELTERSSSILMVQRARKMGVSCIRRCNGGGGESGGNLVIAASFKAYSQLCKVKVRPTTSISALSTMHEDICHVAEKKRAAMVILPFHKAWRSDGGKEIEMNFGNGWREVNRRVLTNAPCSVAMLVDRGFGVAHINGSIKRVRIIFLGGPDCRKALQLGCRMAEHPTVRVSVIRLKLSTETQPDEVFKEHNSSSRKSSSREKELDEAILAELRRKWDGAVEYTEKETDHLVKEVVSIGRSGEFQLVIVGRGQFSPGVTGHLEDRKLEFEELGLIGGLISSSGEGFECSVLVTRECNSVAECTGVPNPGLANYQYVANL